MPGHLIKNQIRIDRTQAAKIEESLKATFFQGWRSEGSFSDKTFMADLKAHLLERLESDRFLYIPWLDKNIRLRGANILEIGCGTGSSTVALAEQGANVTAVDIEEEALAVARERCKIYNLQVNFIHGNASEISDVVKDQKFDLVIFFACMEHMTYQERILCLKQFYDLLPAGGFLSIVDTPNRLWYVDEHTSWLPFFHWLPDNLAFDYTRYSPREFLNQYYHEYSEDMLLHFLRRGRGFSYHEIEIALNIRASQFQGVNYLKRYFLPFSLDRKYHKFLIKMNPGINKGFFYPKIDIMIKK